MTSTGYVSSQSSVMTTSPDGFAHGAVHRRAVALRRELLDDAAAELLRDLGRAVFARVDEQDLGVGRDAADVAR